eukprot:946701-Rhodomonas_salina.2
MDNGLQEMHAIPPKIDYEWKKRLQKGTIGRHKWKHTVRPPHPRPSVRTHQRPTAFLEICSEEAFRDYPREEQQHQPISINMTRSV